MDAARQTQIGQIVGLDLYERKWTGTAIVVARREDLVAVHAAIAERWRSLLAAMSAGIAHADPYEDTSSREKELSDFGTIAIVAPGASSSANASRRVVLIGVEDANALPADMSVAYAVAPLSVEWRAKNANVTIVEVP